MAETAPSGERPDADLIRSLEAADIHPLWDRYQRITPIEPSATDAARIWRWRDFEPFTARAAAEVPVEDVERRALIMANPDFGGQTVTTQNLLSAFTVLEPGDRAVPHRHTAAAIRFSTRAEGAATIVNGRRCDMLPGDLILTPPMCWHGHINDSDHRIMWFDAANIPLMNTLDANFFEPGSREDNAFWHDRKGASMNAIRTRTLIGEADVVVVRFGDKYRQWNAAFDAGMAAALGKAMITLHEPAIDHALKEVDAAALAVCRTPEQVAQTLAYVIRGQLPGRETSLAAE